MKGFRQKQFGGLVMNGLMAGTSVIGVAQGASANKQAEQSAEDQMLEMKRHNKAMEAAAQANPILANSVSEAQQQFSVIGFAKDIGRIAKNNRKAVIGAAVGSAALGAGFVPAQYAVDRAIQYDIKRRGEELPRPAQEKNFANGATTLLKNSGSVLSEVKGYGRDFMHKAGKEMISPLSFVFAGLGGLGYVGKRMNEKKLAEKTGSPGPTTSTPQSSATPGQRNYGFSLSTKGITNALGLGMGGYDTVQKIGKTLRKDGTHRWTRKIGEQIQKHDKIAAWGSLVPGFALAGATMGAGEKLIRKPLEAVDKNAFAYEKSQEQAI